MDIVFKLDVRLGDTKLPAKEQEYLDKVKKNSRLFKVWEYENDVCEVYAGAEGLFICIAYEKINYGDNKEFDETYHRYILTSVKNLRYLRLSMLTNRSMQISQEEVLSIYEEIVNYVGTEYGVKTDFEIIGPNRVDVKKEIKKLSNKY